MGLRRLTRKQRLALMQVLFLQPARHSLPGLLCDLELNRPAYLPLHHRRSGPYPTIEGHVVDAECNEVTGSQLAVERQIEQGQIPDTMSNLEPDPNGPDLLRLERRFGSNQLAPVPRCSGSGRDGQRYCLALPCS
jgi:hypothetical protein